MVDKNALGELVLLEIHLILPWDDEMDVKPSVRQVLYVDVGDHLWLLTPLLIIIHLILLLLIIFLTVESDDLLYSYPSNCSDAKSRIVDKVYFEKISFPCFSCNLRMESCRKGKEISSIIDATN